VVGTVKKEIAGERRFSFVHARAAAASIGQRWQGVERAHSPTVSGESAPA
jgi:hypothetical protein